MLATTQFENAGRADAAATGNGLNAVPAGIFLPVQTTETVPSRTWETLAENCQYRAPELARLCHVSLRTLQRHFRKHYQTTVSEWMRAVRLERARAMLSTAESIKRVSFDLGYKQPSHFTRDFKQHFGIAPSAFRWQTSIEFRVRSNDGGPISQRVNPAN